jgi:hypothetical protein
VNNFELHAPYQPTGDQPEAIVQLVRGINEGFRHQVLLERPGLEDIHNCPGYCSSTKACSGYGA